jgi:hypothetical protein
MLLIFLCYAALLACVVEGSSNTDALKAQLTNFYGQHNPTHLPVTDETLARLVGNISGDVETLVTRINKHLEMLYGASILGVDVEGAKQQQVLKSQQQQNNHLAHKPPKSQQQQQQNNHLAHKPPKSPQQQLKNDLDLLEQSARGKLAQVERLLSDGADANFIFKVLPSLLNLLELKCGYEKCVQFDGQTPLLSAAMNGHIHVVHRLLSAGADCNAKNKVNKGFVFPQQVFPQQT